MSVSVLSPRPLPSSSPQTPPSRAIRNGAIAWGQIAGGLVARLLSTRFALAALGVEAMGAYLSALAMALIASIVTGALQSTTLRALSLAPLAERPRLFNALIGLHLRVALGVAGIGAVLGPPALARLFDLPPALADQAQVAFFCVLAASVAAIALAPYEIALQVRERFGLFAALDLARAVALIPVAFLLGGQTTPPLAAFAALSAGLSLSVTLAGAWRVRKSLPETRLHLRWILNFRPSRGQTALLSWSVLGGLAASARAQGMVLLMAALGGPVASAAYGLGNQLPAALRQFAEATRQVLAPRIYADHAALGSDGSITGALVASRIAALIAFGAAIPMAVNAPALLSLWLGRSNPEMVLVVRLMLAALALDQLSAGLGLAFLARGRIAWMQGWGAALAVMSLPAAFLAGRASGEIGAALWVALAVTTAIAALRIMLLTRLSPGTATRWARETLIPVLASVLPVALGAALVQALLPEGAARLALSLGLCAALWLGVSWRLGLSAPERARLTALLRRRPTEGPA
ncbi:hypothetical protein [Thioclava sp. DLFJ4-1]|uniref:lipopolysaccharide biosynthesis protein n=1 Tax=Thioclava sp. DLFJ4-1 TaxID=1915313 RepID=UPI00117D5DC5|nr:hypothetical protein [Thioclava sp. DLFJ4-1]